MAAPAFRPTRFSTGAWADAAALLGGPALAFAVVLAGSLDGLGTFNALVLSLTRLPYAMAEDGLLPRFLRRRTARGVPWVSVLACALGWALALGFTFERLISIDLVLYGAALLLEFVALVVLRLREPGMPRPFRVPGGTGAVMLSAGPAALIGFACRPPATSTSPVCRHCCSPHWSQLPVLSCTGSPFAGREARLRGCDLIRDRGPFTALRTCPATSSSSRTLM